MVNRLSLFLYIPLVGLALPIMVLQAQNMSELYAADFLTLEAQGNAPHTVAKYWNQIGSELLKRLQAGEDFGLKNRDQLVAGLIDLNGSLLQQPDDVKRQILEKIREQRLANNSSTNFDRNPAYVRNEIDRARRIFDLMGPDLAQRLVVEKLSRRLPSHFGKNPIDEKISLREFLSHQVLREAIGITAKQHEKILRYISEARKEFESEAKETIATITIRTDRQWADFLSRLDDEQREKVKAVVGQPIEWYSSFDIPERWNRHSPFGIREFGRRRQVFYGSEVDSGIDDRGRWPHEMSNEELGKLGLIKADRLLVQLIDEPMIQSYLELDFEQQEGWRILKERYSKSGILYFANNEDRKSELQTPTDDLYPDEIESLLNDGQIKDLRWLEYQARTGGAVFENALRLLPKETATGLRFSFKGTLSSVIRELNSDPWTVRKARIRQGQSHHGTKWMLKGIDTKPAMELVRIRDTIEQSLSESIYRVLRPDQIDKYRNLIFSSRRQIEGG